MITKVWTFTRRNGPMGTSLLLAGCAYFSDKVFQVNGPSMMPTLNPSGVDTDIIRTQPLKPTELCHLQRGDVITFINPKDPKEMLIKRVLALEGDRVTDGYFDSLHTDIPKGHVWVEGDNPVGSLDSREFGPLPKGLVRAKVKGRWCMDWRRGFVESLAKKAGDDDEKRVTHAEDVERGKVFFGWDAAWQE